MRYFSLIIILCINLFSLSTIRSQDSPLKVVATTTIIADVAQNVGGDQVEVQAIIPPDADPHGYQATPGDVVSIAEAEVIFVNGAGLEEVLLEIVEENANVNPIVVSAGIDMLSSEVHNHDEEEHDDEEEHHDDVDCDDEKEHDDEEEHDDEHIHHHGACDPHFWMSPHNVKSWVTVMAMAFSEADPENEATYQANAEAYIQQLEMLEEEIQEMVETLPEDNRILVTNHNFLGYFAMEFGFEVVGLVIPGTPLLADVTPAHLTGLVDMIKAEGVPAIFAEVSVSSELAQMVVDELNSEVALVTLYSGSLSDSDGPASTYLDYMRYNATAIVDALNGQS